MWLTLKVDLVIFAGILLAICLRRSADALASLVGIGRGWALAVVALAILAGLASIGWFFQHSIASQIDQLSAQLPAAAEKLGKDFENSSIGHALNQHVESTGAFRTSTSGFLKGVFGVASNAVEVFGGLIVILFLGLYFAAEAERYERGLVRLVPPRHRARAAQVLEAAATAVWGWLRGRLVAMVTLGVMTALGLWALGVPLPVSLGFLSGLLIFVPYIGSVASAVPAVLLAASVKLSLALWVIGLYVGIHLIEGYVLVPLVQRRLAHLPPALILAGQLVLGMLAGLLGLLFATPLMAAALVLVRMIYVEDMLGDRPEDLPGSGFVPASRR